ncbi:MAG: hypothetical protein FWD59_05865, partial [Micrococcales bacterium]|nr:hypothetical protein [Micrococcales bacterium]
ILAIVGFLAWYWANRVDRLHRGVEAARASLAVQLATRAGAALDLAQSGLLDPASSLVLGEVARQCLDLGSRALGEESRGARLSAEDADCQSELSEAVAMALEPAADAEPLPAEALAGLSQAWYRAKLARRFYNEAVRKAIHLRKHWGVRVFRLAGHTAMPQPFDMNDDWPPGLERM